jgi:hypothetical protein
MSRGFLAVIALADDQATLLELADGITVEQVLTATEAELTVPAVVGRTGLEPPACGLLHNTRIPIGLVEHDPASTRTRTRGA